jgi:hypothetical protein
MSQMSRQLGVLGVVGVVLAASHPVRAQTVPPNDDIADASVLTLASPQSFDLLGASASSSDPVVCPSNVPYALYNTIWYQYTAVTSESLTISINTSDVVDVFSGTPDQLQFVDCSGNYPNSKVVRFDTTPGVSYYFLLGSTYPVYSSSPGMINLAISSAPNSGTISAPTTLDAINEIATDPDRYFFPYDRVQHTTFDVQVTCLIPADVLVDAEIVQGSVVEHSTGNYVICSSGTGTGPIYFVGSSNNGFLVNGAATLTLTGFDYTTNLNVSFGPTPVTIHASWAENR